MKYSYEFKKECVNFYREGKWTDKPKVIKEEILSDFCRNMTYTNKSFSN